jgi:hypothetical protein
VEGNQPGGPSHIYNIHASLSRPSAGARPRGRWNALTFAESRLRALSVFADESLDQVDDRDEEDRAEWNAGVRLPSSLQLQLKDAFYFGLCLRLVRDSVVALDQKF